MKKLLKTLLPLPVKNFLKKILRHPANQIDRRTTLLAQITRGEKINAVDVGGANGFQPHWSRMFHNLRALIFEPGEESFKQLESTYREKIASGEITLSPSALSDTGGARTLYLTNVPTGSSLLRPNKDSAFVANSSYFYPLREVVIQTSTLADALQKYNFPQPDIIKLDVQGLEYAIIHSMPQEMLKKICLFELEINLLDAYENQVSFAEHLQFFDQLGYQLLDLRTNRGSIPVNGGLSHFEEILGPESRATPAVATRLLETDAIFIPKYEQILANYDLNQLLKLIAILCVYNFYHEALLLVNLLYTNKLLNVVEKDSINNQIKELFSLMRKEIARYERQLQANRGLTWAQYMEVPYPSF